MSATCVRCERPMAEMAYVDQHCAERALWQLLGDDSDDRRPGIADMAVAARDIAQGQSRRGGGGGSGKPGSRLPLDLAVTAKIDAVQGELTTWARHVAETRSGGLAHAGADPIVHAAQYLAANLEWLRHRREADEAFDTIEACWRVLRGVVREPAAQKYLGPCGAPTRRVLDEVGPWTAEVPDTFAGAALDGPPCEGDVYGYRGAQTGTCRTCGAQVDQAERSAWLDGEVRGHAFRASEIAGAYGVNVNTIRSWHARGQLAEHGRDRDDRPLFNVGDVLDLAATDAARREENRARRARRMGQRSGGEAA